MVGLSKSSSTSQRSEWSSWRARAPSAPELVAVTLTVKLHQKNNNNHNYTTREPAKTPTTSKQTTWVENSATRQLSVMQPTAITHCVCCIWCFVVVAVCVLIIFSSPMCCWCGCWCCGLVVAKCDDYRELCVIPWWLLLFFVVNLAAHVCITGFSFIK